jgi:hypothetical protein
MDALQGGSLASGTVLITEIFLDRVGGVYSFVLRRTLFLAFWCTVVTDLEGQSAVGERKPDCGHC